VFRAWQVTVTVVAVAFMLQSINAGTPFWVSVTTALLMMSILAADRERDMHTFPARQTRR